MDGSVIPSLPMYRIAGKVGSVFQNLRTRFFNVNTDIEMAFGIENRARSVGELVGRGDRDGSGPQHPRPHGQEHLRTVRW